MPLLAVGISCCQRHDGEQTIQVDGSTITLVACHPFKGFAVGVGVMTFGPSSAYDGIAYTLSDGGGNDARDFHVCLPLVM